VGPLERLFTLEVEFHRRLREVQPVTFEARSLHTSWAIQASYETLLRNAGRVSASDVHQLSQRLLSACDPRDVLAARNSAMLLLCIKQFGQGG
jgi:hypothetical protein